MHFCISVTAMIIIIVIVSETNTTLVAVLGSSAARDRLSKKFQKICACFERVAISWKDVGAQRRLIDQIFKVDHSNNLGINT